ncbi:phage tail protein [Phaeobacter sp. B1627]|uniref:phage tail protein n=1 Tax=Phaeobacter sp. B1627 TaxID=2583809 RepID=UPI00111A5128|nr:tail fiber protein [Phaeobacter sp. B1627]TNJ39618.1 phage tail protein [Phaeobacter sp. B1627]
MAEPFVGEIRMFAGTFAPRGWAFCDGQLLAVSQNDALFSLLGTIYGGDGRTTFGLPDLRGRLPIHAGTGPGLTPRRLGSRSGSETVTLTTNQLPSHSHTFNAIRQPAVSTSPQDHLAAEGVGVNFYTEADQDTNMASAMITHTGGSRSHTNLMPFLCLHFIVALFGIYPSRH